MKIFTVAALLLSGAVLGGCQTVYEEAAAEVAQADVLNRSGEQVGTANFYSLAGEITVNVAFSDMTPGLKAVHLHTTGDCSAADFTSAGGHLNPAGREHGTMNPRGAHLGDLPNVTIGENGMGTLSALLEGTTDAIMGEIFDADGTAIVVHEGPDDYRSDPAGDAGSRVACGVVERA